MASGEDAVTATADRDFDAVLMDVQLRDHDGDGIDGLRLRGKSAAIPTGAAGFRSWR